MHYLALACDYDGTLATHGKVHEETIQALERVVASGRKLILVTGRILADLQHVFDRLDLFDYIVAENGAVLYHPATTSEKRLGEAPPERFIQMLRARGVTPLATGSVITATTQPHETSALAAIRALGLELQVIFNKGAVMILPEGINKGTGLAAALRELKFSAHNVAGIGDAENDHSFLQMCECSVAVANALPALKEQADFTTSGSHGAGVVELIEHLLADDLQEISRRVTRHILMLGRQPGDEPVLLHPQRASILIAGPSGSGKSTLATSLLEQLATQAYQFCLIDPEGDYETVQEAITLGDAHKEPGISEIIQLLEKSESNAVVNLLGSPLAERPSFVRNLLPAIQDLQTRYGHPHWLILDEAHHLFPREWDASMLVKVHDQFSLLLITAHPEHMSRQVLELVDTIISVGTEAFPILTMFSTAVGQHPPTIPNSPVEPGEIAVWFRRTQQVPLRARPLPPRQEHLRHKRKYAQGDLGEDVSFYFRGPQNKLNLRAQNLQLFTQIAHGVDDETWLFHLRRGDYSHWFRHAIKDEDLALEVGRIERDQQISARESRARIQAAIEQRYTLPA
ncbi:MAG: HAD family hydrolase [Ktedonobacteraceae bacterium]|nr:HAD family hydrolase [Ktedonobacteraceae bacterium]